MTHLTVSLVDPVGPPGLPPQRFGIIYLITCLVNGKVYVGQTRGSLGKRWSGHVTDSGHRRSRICNAIRKYGRDSFKIEEIDVAYFREELNRLEMHWIKTLKTTDDKIGYNITTGGESHDVSLQTKIRNAEHFIECVETGEVFVSTVDASLVKNVSKVGVGGCVRGRCLSAGGFTWRRREKEGFDINLLVVPSTRWNDEKRKNTNLREVVCNETGERYPSITAAAKNLGLSVPRMFQIVNRGICRNGFTYQAAKRDHPCRETSKEAYRARVQSRIALTSKKVKCLETGEIWSSATEAAKSADIHSSYMSQVLLHRGGFVKGRNYTYID